MSGEEKQQLLQAMFNGAQLTNVQVIGVVESGAKVVFSEVHEAQHEMPSASNEPAEVAPSTGESKPPMARPEPTETSAVRMGIWRRLERLIEKGDWQSPASAENIRELMSTALGIEGQPLSNGEQAMSEALWHMLTNGRGDRVQVTWQNLVGYFASRGFFPRGKGAPALNDDFFGTRDNYTNIDKGRPSNGCMPAGLRDALPLIERLSASLMSLRFKV